MRYLLTAFGHQVRLARNAELALPQISKDAFDGILCDIQLPGKSGYDIAKELNANPDLRAIPLLAVTALAMSGDRERIIEAGFKGYITKPIDPESFVSNIEALIHSLKPDSRSIPARLVSQNTETARIPPTLLVVDNQKVNLELACSLLCPLGFLVLTAENIQEAFLHLQNNLVDLILSDICMANGSGFDFIREVKSQAKYSKIPFIFLTSTQTNSVARTKGLALGANRFLFRPIDPEILLSEIQNTLNERGLLPPWPKY
jgi:two-component system cell cycle response regulator